MISPQALELLELLSDPKYALVFLLLAAWSFVWKGFALWRAAGNKHKVWFIGFLIINSFGILEIAYLFYFSKSNVEEPV